MTSWIFPSQPVEQDPGDVLAISFEMRDATTVVSLDGPVCAYTAPHLDAELRRVEEHRGHCVVVDASGVHTMSSDGLDVLVAHAERCHEAGGRLVLRHPSPVTQRVLAVCGLGALTEPARVLRTV